MITDSRSRLQNYITNTLSASESAALTITLTLTVMLRHGQIKCWFFFTLISAHRLTLTLTQLHNQHSAQSHSCSHHIIGRLNVIFCSPWSVLTRSRSHRLVLFCKNGQISCRELAAYCFFEGKNPITKTIFYRKIKTTQ